MGLLVKDPFKEMGKKLLGEMMLELNPARDLT